MAGSSRNKAIFFVIAAVVVILFFVGFIGGAIGGKLLDEEEGFLKVPVLEIHEFFKGDVLFSAGPLDVTNTLIASWLTVIVVAAFAYFATRKMRIVPKRLQGVVEVGVESLMNFVVSVAGEKNGRRFFPIIATIFIFVMFNAYFALMPFFGPGITLDNTEHLHAHYSGTVHIEENFHSQSEHAEFKVEKDDVIMTIDGHEVKAPLTGHMHFEVHDGEVVGEDAPLAVVANVPPVFRSANTDVNMTLALAIIAVLCIEFWGLRSRGFRHYIVEYINMGELRRGFKLVFTGKLKDAPMSLLMGVINAFMGFIEMLSHGIRMISFTFRLFGNMTAGEILLISATFLVPWIMAIPFYGLEVLVGFIQALIFGGLTLVWATMAVEHAAEEHAEHA